MAVITIAAGGGNWNSTSTWVGGVVPTSADSIVGNSTSGQLTVNVTTPVLIGMDFTGYTNTVTISAGVDFQSTTTITLSSTMTIAGTGWLVSAGAATITTNGCVIPFFQFLNAGTRTLADNLNCGTCGTTNNSNVTVNGNAVITQNFLQGNRGGGFLALFSGTTIFRVQGTGCTWNAGTAREWRIQNPVQINATGALTITGGINIAFNGSITWTSGTLAGDKRIFFNSGANIDASIGNATMDLNAAGTWDEVYIAQKQTANITVTLNSNLNFNSLVFTKNQGSSPTGKFRVIFAGSGVLNGGSISMTPMWLWNEGGGPVRLWPVTLADYAGGIRLAPGSTHTFSAMNFYGVVGSKPFIECSGGTASVNYTGTVQNQMLLYTDFTNIIASGSTLYTLNGAVSGSTNIQVANNYVPTAVHTFIA